MDGRPGNFATSVFRAQPDEGPQRKIQKRNRPPVSCLLCRTRKVKCDRQQPCERCVKSGEANFCEYAPRATRKSRAEPKTHADPRQKHEHLTRPALRLRLQKLEDMVSGLVHSAQTGENALETPPSSEQRNDIEGRSDLSSPPSVPTQPAGLVPTTQIADSSYVGTTHWASVLESIHDIRGIVETELDMPPSPSPPPRPRTADSPDLVFGRQAPITREQAVLRLPPRNRTDQLVLLYFRSRFTAAPYIHTNKFQREYDGFWRDSSSVSLLWMSCLASILSTASSISMARGEDLSKETQLAHPENLSALATECLVAGNYLSGKPYSIEALMLHGYTEMRNSGELNMEIWAKFGLLARLAQRLGYHRDPKYLSNVTPFEGEIRRRLWFFIEVFDVLFAFTLGIPPIIRDDECDTDPPGNLYDSDFDENTTVLPPSRPATEATSTLYLNYKSRLCRLLRRVIRYSMAIHPISYQEIIALDGELRRYHDQIPPSLQLRPIRSYSFTDTTPAIMQRLMLEMMYLKSLMVLHRPYLNSEKDNPTYNISRTTCREAALRLLDLHVEYDEESRPGGRMFDDKYMLSSLNIHDFLIASMILCLDLMENAPRSPEERTRSMKALGASYKIWSERKHASKEAAHATKVVGAILRKISLQEPQANQPAPPPLRPQPEVRDGSLASLLNNDSPSQPAVPRRLFDQTSLMHAMNFSLDFSDTLPLDNVLGGPQMVDWIILDRPGNTFATVP
ncbi:hypothetical protein DL766_003741 [Monosporascus sp. MC13-8B]|nr:hypothetical protein DL763_010319 [Monosporascus cannonballus]RYP32935.1 hypothetical protein DL766_003741 [Monosporascus sp. MC13-8B]